MAAASLSLGRDRATSAGDPLRTRRVGAVRRASSSRSSSTSVALGPTDFSERDTTHFGWLRHAATKSRSSTSPLRTIFVPIAHGLIQAATVDTAGQAAHVLYEMTKERRAWPHFKMVDVAVQGLVHSKDDLRHATKSPPQVLQNSLSRRCAEVRLDTICAPHCRCDQ